VPTAVTKVVLLDTALGIPGNCRKFTCMRETHRTIFLFSKRISFQLHNSAGSANDVSFLKLGAIFVHVFGIIKKKIGGLFLCSDARIITAA
jgi:hypothetical protein